MKDSEILKKQLSLIAERIMIEGDRIPDEELIIEYDNGGGQMGVRENPFYPAYEKLLASYTRALEALKDISGDDAEVTTLADLRSRFKVAK